MNTKWKLKYKRNSEETFSESIRNMFAERGINDINSKFHNPFLMKDMTEGVTTLMNHSNKKILIFGDYDADGITSTVLLYSFLKDKLNFNVDYMIPDRLTEGYGMKDFHAHKIVELGYDLVITVDTGIASIDEISILKDNNIGVIVTDHHLPKETLPKADAVINPQRHDCHYPFKGLAGVGVALKFIQAVSVMTGLKDAWLDYVDLAMLGTIGDVMPLEEENRLIVKIGMKRMLNSNNKGLKTLAAKALSGKSYDSVSLSFYLIPVINASSRLGKIDLMMDLLLSKGDVNELATQLMVLNDERKQLSSIQTEEAISQVLDTYDFDKDTPIVVYNSNWHKGLIGIIAAKLTDKFKRPAIVFTKDKDGWVGSSRTFGSVSIIEVLNDVSDHIFAYGGHEGAAGLTVKDDNLKDFIEAVYNYNGQKDVPREDIKFVDMICTIPEMTPLAIDQINEHAPFGESNPEPLFLIPNLTVSFSTKMGKKKGAVNAHMRANLEDKNGNKINAIGFFNSVYADLYPSGSKVHLIARVANEGGRITYFIEGIKPMSKDEKQIKYQELNSEYISSKDYIEDIAFKYSDIEIKDLLPSNKDLAKLLNVIARSTDPFTSKTALLSIINHKVQDNQREMNHFSLTRALEIFSSTGLIEYVNIDDDNIYVKLVKTKVDVPYKETDAFKEIKKRFRI